MTWLILALVGFGGLAAGLLIGRYYVPDDRALKRTARHAKSYMRAINFLLSRERDAAVDELKSVVTENVNDVEPYFALGALFRRRGEWERAIRVHQAIELRTESDRKTKLRARYELGLDFRAAGMPRRATRAMEDCLAEDNKHIGALRALCGLYEEQARYSEAAQSWKRLDKLTGEQSPREHHLLIAAAKLAIAAGDTDSAKRYLREAERHDDHSVHLLTAYAELAAAKENPQGASARLAQALSVAPDLAAYLVPGLYAAEREMSLERGEGKGEDSEDTGDVIDRETARATVEVIERVVGEIGPNPHLMLAVAELRSHYDPERALTDYRDVAIRFPDLLPARIASARLALASGDADEIQSELVALVSADGALSWATEGSWRCSRCGHHGARFFWRCSGCRHWGTVRLDVGRDADEPIDEPRDRRGAPRKALLAGGLSLPAPGLESGLSDSELVAANERRGLLGRAGSFLAGAWSAVRGRGD